MSKMHEITCIACGNIAMRYGTAKMCHPCSAIHWQLQRQAGLAVQKAICQGKLAPVDTLLCVDCSAPAKCYDHRNYHEPLAVDPVCVKCNSKRGPAISAIYI